MRKPTSLRKAIEDGVPEFAREPDRLKVWIEDGAGISRQTASLAFGFSYRLHILLEEVRTDIALIVLPIFQWLRVNQPDLLSPGKQGFAFDADLLDNGTSDILIQLELTENVTVATRPEGGWQLNYLPEPDPMFESDMAPAGLTEVPDLTEVVIATGPRV